jgi:hypothetical protein
MNTNFNLQAYKAAVLEEKRRVIKELSAELEKNPEDKFIQALLYLVKGRGDN